MRFIPQDYFEIDPIKKPHGNLCLREAGLTLPTLNPFLMKLPRISLQRLIFIEMSR
jgi:hypothetical protein